MDGFLREKESEYLERFHLRELAEAWLANVANEMPADPYASLISAARWQREHGGGVVTCPNKWCKATMPASEFHVHSVFCNNESNWTRCSRCNGRVAISQLESHQVHCHITCCPLCGESVLPRLLCFCPYKLLQQTERDRLAHCIELPTRFSDMFKQPTSTQDSHNMENSHNYTHSVTGSAAMDDVHACHDNEEIDRFIMARSSNDDNDDRNGVTEKNQTYESNDTTHWHSSSIEPMEFQVSQGAHESIHTEPHKWECAEQTELHELEEYEYSTHKKEKGGHLSDCSSQEHQRKHEEECHDAKNEVALFDTEEDLHKEEVAKDSHSSGSKNSKKNNTTPVFSSVENVRQSSWWRALSKRVLSHNRRTHSPVAFQSLLSSSSSLSSSLAATTNAAEKRRKGEERTEVEDTSTGATLNENELSKEVPIGEENDMLTQPPIQTLSNRRWTKRNEKYRANRITLDKSIEAQIQKYLKLELPSPQLGKETHSVSEITVENTSQEHNREVKTGNGNNNNDVNDEESKEECSVINNNLDLIEDDLECHSPIFKATRWDKQQQQQQHQHMSHLPQFGILVNNSPSLFTSPLFDDTNKSDFKFMNSPLSSINTAGSTVVFTKSIMDSYSDFKQNSVNSVNINNNKNQSETCSRVMSSLSKRSLHHTNDGTNNNNLEEQHYHEENKQCMTSMTLLPEHISLLTQYAEQGTLFPQAEDSLRAIQITWKRFTMVQNYRHVLFRAIWFNLEQAYERRATAQSISLSQLTSQITLEWTRMQEAKLKETKKELLEKQEQPRIQENTEKEYSELEEEQKHIEYNSNNNDETTHNNNNNIDINCSIKNNVLSDKHEINETMELLAQKDECTDIEVREIPNDKGAFMSVSNLEKLTALNKRRSHLPLQLVLRIINAATLILRSRPVIQHVTIPSRGQVIVVGDLHGQLKDLFHILHSMGRPNHVRYYVFNGDFLDRGPFGCEVIVHLYALLCTFPEFVYLNRGNHEDCKTNHEYGLIQELYTKYTVHAAMVHDALVESYTELPLITLLDHRICIVHGGVPRNETTLQSISELGKQRDIPVSIQRNASELLLADLLWNDPVEKFRSRRLGAQHSGPGWRSSKRGCGVEYLPIITHKFLKKNKLELIVRSHEVVLAGFELLHHNKSITVFSASNYGGISGNRGAVAVFVKNTTLPKFNTWFIKEDVEARMAIARRLHKPIRQELHLQPKELEKEEQQLDKPHVTNSELSEQFMRRSSSPAFCSTTCVEIQMDNEEMEEFKQKQKQEIEKTQDPKCDLLFASLRKDNDVHCNPHAANFNVAVLLEEDALFAGDEYILTCFGNCFVDVDTHLLTQLSQSKDNNNNYLTSNEWSTGQNTPSVFSPSPPSSPESSQYIHTHSTVPSRSYSFPSSEANLSLTEPHVHVSCDESMYNSHSSGSNAIMEMKRGYAIHTEHYTDDDDNNNKQQKINTINVESPFSLSHEHHHQQITNSCWENSSSFWGQLRLGRDATSTLLQLRTISDIREHIYLNRYTLMMEFNDQDEDCDGAIYKPEWSTILHDVLHMDLPWYYLCHFIYCPSASINDGNEHVTMGSSEHVTLIQYARFLRHYDSLFAQRFMNEWQVALIKRVFETVDLPEDIIYTFDSRMSDFNTSTSTMSMRNNSCVNSVNDESINSGDSNSSKNNSNNISNQNCNKKNSIVNNTTTKITFTPFTSQKEQINVNNESNMKIKKETLLALEEIEEENNSINTIIESDGNSSTNHIQTIKHKNFQGILNKSTSSDIRNNNKKGSTTTCFVPILLPSSETSSPLSLNNANNDNENEYCHRENAAWRDVLVSFKTFANEIRNLSPVLATMEDNLLYCLFAFFDSHFRGHITLGELVDGVNDVLHSKRRHRNHNHHHNHNHNHDNKKENNINNCDSDDDESNECSSSDLEFGSSSLEIVEDGEINFSFGNDHESVQVVIHEQSKQPMEATKDEHHKYKDKEEEKHGVNKLVSPTLNWFDACQETEMGDVMKTSQTCHRMEEQEEKEEEEEKKEQQTSSSHSVLPNSTIVSSNSKLDQTEEIITVVEDNTDNNSNNVMQEPVQSDLPFIPFTTPNASHKVNLTPEKPINMVHHTHSIQPNKLQHNSSSSSSSSCLQHHKMHGNDSVSSLKYCTSHTPSHFPHLHFTESESNLPYATILPRLIQLYHGNKKLYDEMMLVLFPFMTRLHEEMIGGDTHARMRAVFSALDTNQDGKLCWSEFAMLMSLLDDQLEVVLTKEQRQFAFHLVHDEAIRYLFHLRSRYVYQNETDHTNSSNKTEKTQNDTCINGETELNKIQTTETEFDVFMRARTDEETLTGEEFITLSEFRALFSVIAVNTNATVPITKKVSISTYKTEVTFDTIANSQYSNSNNKSKMDYDICEQDERQPLQNEEVNDVQSTLCSNAIADVDNITLPTIQKDLSKKPEMLPLSLPLTLSTERVNIVNEELQEYEKEFFQDDLQHNKHANMSSMTSLKRNKCFYNPRRLKGETCQDATESKTEDRNFANENNVIDKLVEGNVSNTFDVHATNKVEEKEKESSTSIQALLNQLISRYGAHTSLEDLKNKVDDTTFTDLPLQDSQLLYNSITNKTKNVHSNSEGDKEELIAPLETEHNTTNTTSNNISPISLPSSYSTWISELHEKLSQEEKQHQDAIKSEIKDTHSHFTVQTPQSIIHQPRSSLSSLLFSDSSQETPPLSSSSEQTALLLSNIPLSPNQIRHNHHKNNKSILFKVINTGVNSPPLSSSPPSDRNDNYHDEQQQQQQQQQQQHHHHNNRNNKHKHKHHHSNKHIHSHEDLKHEIYTHPENYYHNDEHNTKEKTMPCVDEEKQKEQQQQLQPVSESLLPLPPSTQLAHTTKLHNKGNSELSFMSIDSNRMMRRTCSFSSVSTADSTFSSSSPSSLLNHPYILNINSSSCCSSPCDSLHFGRHPISERYKAHSELPDNRMNRSPSAEAHYLSSASSFNRVMKSVNLSIESISSLHNVESPLSMEPPNNFHTHIDNNTTTNNENDSSDYYHYVKRSHSPFTCKPIEVPNSLFEQDKKIISNSNDNIDETNIQNKNDNIITGAIKPNIVNDAIRNSANVDNVNVSWDDTNKTIDLQRTLRNVRKSN